MKRVIITGASKGIGKAIRNLLESPIFLTGEPKYKVADLSRTSGVDLTKLSDSQIRNILNELNPHILILNAGVWKNEWKLNYEVSRAMAERMPKDKLVIFLLSNAAYRSYGNDDYTAAKSGLLHYANRKQMEGYHFATIAPGTVDTGFWDKAEVDNRKRGCLSPAVIADSVYHIIKQAEKGALITEMIILPS